MKHFKRVHCDTAKVREHPKTLVHQPRLGDQRGAGVMTLGTVKATRDATMENPQRSFQTDWKNVQRLDGSGLGFVVPNQA